MLLGAAVLAACAFKAAGAPPSPAATREYHVRALDPRVREWIRLGAAESPTFNELLDRLAASDVIVYVQIVDRIPSGADGQIFFVTSTDTARYLRIEIEGKGRPLANVSLLGHELQHAVEIADAPRVRDSQAMAAMYRRVGDPSTWYDSAAARLVGERVRDELARARERSGAPTASQ